METKIGINIGSGNGVLLNGTKPLPELLLFVIGEILWHSPESNFTTNSHFTIIYNEFDYYTLKLLPRLPGSRSEIL